MSLTGFGAFTSIGLQNTTAGAVLITDAPVQGARTYTVPANTTATFTVIGGLTDPSPSYTWSCVSAAGSTGGNDSQKLTSVQTQGSTVVSSTSGSNISGSVNSAIDSSLSGTASTGGSSGTSSVTMSREEFAEQYASAQLHGVKPSGRDDRSLPASLVAGYYSKYDEGLALYDSMIAKGQVPVVDETARLGFKFVSATSLSFAEDRSPVARRADEAFASLGYVAFTKAPRKPSVFASQWSTWADVRGSGFDRSDTRALNGTQINATGGITYRLRSDLVVGAFAGYENFNYDIASLTGNLKGNGGTIGSYAGWQVTPTLRWKGMIGWTGLGYDASAGTAAGSFDGSRWLVSTGLTGSHRVAAFILEPSVDVFALWEHQTGYTDTLGALHDARNFSTGRVALGGRALAPMPGWSGVTPYLGFYGDWRFSTNNSVPVGVAFVGLSDGWSGRVTGGVNVPIAGGGTVALGGEYGGLGANYGVWTANARLNWPF